MLVGLQNYWLTSSFMVSKLWMSKSFNIFFWNNKFSTIFTGSGLVSHLQNIMKRQLHLKIQRKCWLFLHFLMKLNWFIFESVFDTILALFRLCIQILAEYPCIVEFQHFCIKFDIGVLMVAFSYYEIFEKGPPKGTNSRDFCSFLNNL